MKISNGLSPPALLDVVDGDVHGVIAAGPPELVGVAGQHPLALERLGHVDDLARRSGSTKPGSSGVSAGSGSAASVAETAATGRASAGLASAERLSTAPVTAFGR